MKWVIKVKTNIVEHVKDKKLFTETEPIVVALSGGIDSMVLFDIIHQLNNNVIIAHVNHNKRSESIVEYKYIETMANEINIPFEGYSIEETTDNFHHESRLKRYEFFRAIAQKYHSTKIVVAHHLDDQVETVLMRIVRGTSFSGYSGIKEIRYDRNVSIIRPLMEITKEDIVEYSKENNIKFFEDSSNSEDIYTRNRFRHNIIPLLKEENPNLNKKIIQLAEYIDSANEVLEEKTKEFLKAYSMYSNVSLVDFNNLNKVLKIKVIQHMVNNTTNNTVEVSYEQYNAIIDICLSSTPNQTYSLPNTYLFVKEYDVIYIKKEVPIIPISIEVTKEGEYFVDDNKSYIFSNNKITHNYRNYFELCYNELVFPLHIRQRKNGDKMSLKIGSKKVKDILIDKKIPKSERDRLLVLTNDDVVLWIPGVKKSHQDQQNPKKLYIYEVE
ncbi:tRNA(Ile)-lysidine synthase [Candidatus Izimaplasma bacterium HR1]|jgi:tRNA(Ile)-lysidine synthetase-like protein|nr:tRNA(Ile)-lysidine synthase [Candidatus Izimaplasma bacterium HR1]